MPPIRKLSPSAKSKLGRSSSRVENMDETSKAPRKKITPEISDDGSVVISFQASEVVPVAQFANVVIGPAGLTWTLKVDATVLADIDWDDPDVEMTPEQQAVYDRISNALKSTAMLCEQRVATDREIVEEEVRKHNARDAEEKKEARKGNGARKR